LSFSLFTVRPPPAPTLFPYTTLFRSLTPGAGAPMQPVYPRRSSIPLLVGVFFVAVQLVLLARVILLLFGVPGNTLWIELVYAARDRKSTRLNSSHGSISYAVFCLKKK